MSELGGNLVYKCRNCGETYSNCHAPNLSLALSCIMIDGVTPKQWGIPATMIDIHSCKNGEEGIADLVGGIPDKF